MSRRRIVPAAAGLVILLLAAFLLTRVRGGSEVKGVATPAAAQPVSEGRVAPPAAAPSLPVRGEPELDRPGVRGRVLGAAEEPLAAVRITLYAGSLPDRIDDDVLLRSSGIEDHRLAQTRSADDGSFAFWEIEEQPLVLTAEASDYVEAMLEVSWGAEVLVRLLPRVMATALFGQVRDRLGNAVTSFEVRADGCDGDRSNLLPWTTVEEREGRFALTLPLRSGAVRGVELRFHADGFADEVSSPIELTPGTPRSGVVIELERAAPVRGLVCERSGMPIRGAHVMAVLEPGDFGSGTETNENGVFELKVAEGAAVRSLLVRADGFSPRCIKSAEVAGDWHDVRIELVPGAVIRGRVSRIGGEPVAFARVEAVTEDPRETALSLYPYYTGRAVSDADGGYELTGVPQGRVFLRAVCTIEDQERRSSERTLEIRPEDERVEDFVFGSEPRLVGRVDFTMPAMAKRDLWLELYRDGPEGTTRLSRCEGNEGTEFELAIPASTPPGALCLRIFLSEEQYADRAVPFAGHDLRLEPFVFSLEQAREFVHGAPPIR